MTQIGGGAGPRPAQHLDAQIAVLFPPLWPKKAGYSRVVKRNYTRFWQRRRWWWAGEACGKALRACGRPNLLTSNCGTSLHSSATNSMITSCGTRDTI